MSQSKEVPVEKLRWRCDPQSLDFNSTEDLKACEEILGQDRALKAIRLGLDIDSVGYNIFVTGKAGTGRSTTVRRLLEEKEKTEKTPDDKCYVNNFKNPDMPRVISLPAGRGSEFKKDMEGLISHLRKQIPLLFDSEEYQKRKQAIIEEFNLQQQETIHKFEERARQENFALIQVQLGLYSKPDLVPIIDGSPVGFDKLETLVASGQFPQEKLDKLRDRYLKLAAKLGAVFKEMRDREKEMRQKLTTLEHDMVMPAVDHPIAEMKGKYKNEKVNVYLDEVRTSILENLDKFQEKPEPQQPTTSPLPSLQPQVDPFNEYQVNVVVDNRDLKGAPIIFETSPSYKNLFGTIERVMDRMGQWRTDFTKIKAGSFLRANGGYLVINALDALLEPGVWPGLKRTLINRRVEIQSFDPFFMFTTSALKPEPIDTDVKVIMIGDPFIYQLLYHRDEDFKKIFKIRADFDNVMRKEEPNIFQYACYISRLCSEENLKPFDPTGVAGVVEYGVRLAGRKSKLSTQFNHIADLIREASYWATRDNSRYVSEKHVDKALEEKIERVNLIEDKIQEMINEGTIMIDTGGKKVGQVNGLSILDVGDYSFGRPSRITAEVAMGRSGIINIEREAQLSGAIHNKGVLILSGYLRGKYAQDKPLAVSASICFEQSYSGVEGDSASSAEVYALLSELSRLPLRQDIAVTGSVNQKGEIQAIGGVNQKIEGFYDVCKAKALTGTQGVMIPHQNIDDLMLRKDVVQAVKEGKFHVYAVKTIDEGIEILTGVEAGERRPDGKYKKGTVNYLVDEQLRELATKLKDFAAEEKSVL